MLAGGLAYGRYAERRDCRAHQEFVATLVRQRDMFRQLFEQLSGRQGGDSGSTPRGAAAGAPIANGHAGSAAALSQVLPMNPALPVAKNCLESNSCFEHMFTVSFRQMGLLTEGGESAVMQNSIVGRRLLRILVCPQEQANYKQLTEDLETELARVKKDASEHAAQLSAAAQAKGEAASAARSEAARSRVGSCPVSRCANMIY